MAAPEDQRRGTMSLYADLLDPNSGASISRAPVSSAASEAEDASKKALEAGKSCRLAGVDVETTLITSSTALRFQPIRRPQVPQKKVAKPSLFPKSIAAATIAKPPTSSTAETSSDAKPAAATASTGPGPPKSRLADWTSAGNDSEYYGVGPEKRQRGGRKRKKRRDDGLREETDWDELYDPSRPTNVEEYLRSDERIAEVREWKELLYAHRRQRRSSNVSGSESGERDRRHSMRPYKSDDDDGYSGAGSSGDDSAKARSRPARFAPPSSYSFVPPPPENPPPPPQPAAEIPDDATGEDAYARRMAMSRAMAGGAPVPPSHSPAPHHETPPPPVPAPPPTQEEQQEAGVVAARAPVRYVDTTSIEEDAAGPADSRGSGLEEGTESEPATGDTENRKSTLPGQAGFARRLLAKYGWSAGRGLGAAEQGMASALRVRIEKGAKQTKNEDGTKVKTAPRATILEGKAPKKAAKANDDENERGDGDEEDDGFGKISNVVVMRNMLEGLDDLQAEIADGLGQEIGEECGEKVSCQSSFTRITNCILYV